MNAPALTQSDRRAASAAALTELHARAGAMCPPVTAQAVYIGLHLLPADVAANPTGRGFRVALPTVIPPPWRLTRGDIETGLSWLARYRLLPRRGGGRR